MKLLTQLELVEVTFEDAKATLVFLNEDEGTIHEVGFNKKVYDADSKKFVADEEKALKVEEWSQEYFGLSFENLGQAVGDRKDIYTYDTFNSLFEVQTTKKFEPDMVGQILSVEVTDVVLDGEGIRILIDYDGDTYRSNMGFTKKIGETYYVDPIKRGKQIDKFKEKFGFDVESREELVGKTVMIEVKKMGGSNAIYIEIKPFPKKKK